MTNDPSREAFEAWAKTQGPANDEKSTLEHMMFMHIAWIAWQAGAAAERNRCKYPECTSNEDERCPRWLTGDCSGPDRSAS